MVWRSASRKYLLWKRMPSIVSLSYGQQQTTVLGYEISNTCQICTTLYQWKLVWTKVTCIAYVMYKGGFCFLEDIVPCDIFACFFVCILKAKLPNFSWKPFSRYVISFLWVTNFIPPFIFVHEAFVDSRFMYSWFLTRNFCTRSFKDFVPVMRTHRKQCSNRVCCGTRQSTPGGKHAFDRSTLAIGCIISRDDSRWETRCLPCLK